MSTIRVGLSRKNTPFRRMHLKKKQQTSANIYIMKQPKHAISRIRLMNLKCRVRTVENNYIYALGLS